MMTSNPCERLHSEAGRCLALLSHMPRFLSKGPKALQHVANVFTSPALSGGQLFDHSAAARTRSSPRGAAAKSFSLFR